MAAARIRSQGRAIGEHQAGGTSLLQFPPEPIAEMLQGLLKGAMRGRGQPKRVLIRSGEAFAQPAATPGLGFPIDPLPALLRPPGLERVQEISIWGIDDAVFLDGAGSPVRRHPEWFWGFPIGPAAEEPQGSRGAQQQAPGWLHAAPLPTPGEAQPMTPGFNVMQLLRAGPWGEPLPPQRWAPGAAAHLNPIGVLLTGAAGLLGLYLQLQTLEIEMGEEQAEPQQAQHQEGQQHGCVALGLSAQQIERRSGEQPERTKTAEKDVEVAVPQLQVWAPAAQAPLQALPPLSESHPLAPAKRC